MINKSEEEIMSQWEGNKSKPLVSICTLAYNHEKYITDALDSFLMQETNFPFEIIIHDDASTDNTANIIKNYEKKFPSIIKAIYQTENKYSKGIRPSLIVFKKVQGEFTAICEGDDYWCDPFKLKKQLELLKQYPDINFSFHGSVRLNMINQEKNITGNYSKVLELNKKSKKEENNYGYIEESLYMNRYGITVPIEDIILKLNYGIIETSSYIIRSSSLPLIITFFQEHPYVPVGDFYIEILASNPNGGLFIDNIMSVYRLNSSENSWSTKMMDKKKDIEYYNNFLPTVKLIDELTEYKYTQSFHDYFYIKTYMAFTRELNDCFWYKYYQEILDNIIIKLQNTNSDYILYGYGTVGKYIYNKIENQIVNIIDRDTKIINYSDKFLDLEKLEDLEKLRVSEIKIIISPLHVSKRIIKDLIDMGISKNRFINLNESFPNYLTFINKYYASIK
jgi:glycosyltransferase involved in cell wall biosynthesis